MDKNLIRTIDSKKIRDHQVNDDLQMKIGASLIHGFKMIGVNPDSYRDAIIKKQLVEMILDSFGDFSFEDIANFFTWMVDNPDDQYLEGNYGKVNVRWLKKCMNKFKHHRNKVHIDFRTWVIKNKYKYYNLIQTRVKDAVAIPKMILDSFQAFIDDNDSKLPLLTKNCYLWAAYIGLIGFTEEEKTDILYRAQWALASQEKADDEETLKQIFNNNHLRMKYEELTMLYAWKHSFHSWIQEGKYVPHIREILRDHCPLTFDSHEQLHGIIEEAKSNFPQLETRNELIEKLKQYRPNEAS